MWNHHPITLTMIIVCFVFIPVCILLSERLFFFNIILNHDYLQLWCQDNYQIKVGVLKQKETSKTRICISSMLDNNILKNIPLSVILAGPGRMRVWKSGGATCVYSFIFTGFLIARSQDHRTCQCNISIILKYFMLKRYVMIIQGCIHRGDRCDRGRT